MHAKINKITSTPDVLSSSLLTLTSLGTEYSLSFILHFATTLFVLTTEHTERLHSLLNQQRRLICLTHPTKMRRYDIVSGILLILSIIDFALAAPSPVLVQEKRQACIDAVPIPKDVITVLGKRGDEELEKLLEEYFKAMGKPVESSDAHASSSLAPPGPDHGSTVTNAAQSPAPNPASSTANPDPLMEPSGPSSTAPKQGDDGLRGPLYTPTLTEYGSDHELTGAHGHQEKRHLVMRH
ncbi:hypothetical protein V8E52_012058 [Russula decolorans]